MALQVLIFILLFGSIQGLLVFLILLNRKSLRPFHVLLSAYIVALVFQIFLKVATKVWLMEVWPPVYSLSYFLPFLYGPLTYLITRSAIAKQPFQLKGLLHLLPFFLFVLFFAFDHPAIQYPRFVSYLFSPGIRLVLQLTSLVFYHIAAKNLLAAFEGDLRNTGPSQHLAFLKKFVKASLIITCLIAWTLCFMYVAFPNYQYIKWSFIALTVFIYWISFVAFQKPGSFEVILGKLEPTASIPVVKSNLTILPPEAKYANSSLKDEQANQIISVLEEAMVSRKIFLDASITIDKLAETLSCQKHHLSQALNDKLGVSFNEYINRRRTEASKQMLSDPDKNHYTIASIAYDAGFNSLSTFNEVFKKITGLTPSQYRKMSMKESWQQRI